VHTPRFKEALARQSKYFNAHPYLASVAVGALARAELDGEPAEKIERFRTALPGPLGSVGDRLIWAGWLPFCSFVALAVYGLGGGPLGVLLTFLGLYNVVHIALRAWGLRTGWNRGMHVAQALANPVLRRGPQVIAPLAAFTAGLGVPLAMNRIIGPGRTLLSLVLTGAALGAFIIVRLHGRVEGWRLALGVLAAMVLFSVAR
jgi:PTS system mannose-specific IID component